ncbi:MAG: hypothetical protein WKF81_05800 [Thermomicrobiales bacterium]
MRIRHFRPLAILVTIVITLAGLSPAWLGTAFAQDTDLNTWENSAYSITIGWTDDWAVDADEVSSVAPGGDLLELTSADATLTLRAIAPDLSPSDQLAQELEGIAFLNGSEPDITEDSDTVATAEWRSETLSRLVSVIAPDDADGLLVVTLVATDDQFDDAVTNAADNVTVNDQPLLTTSQDEPTEEATEEPEETEVAEPTEESTDDLKLPTEEPLGEGVEGDTYTSPNFGYSFQWDEDAWQVAEDGEISESGYDLLTLTGEFGGVSIYAFEDYNGDPETCLEGETDYNESDPSIEEWEVAENSDGEPIAGATDDTAYALFIASLTDPENENAPARSLAIYLECRSIGGDVILGISAYSLSSVYNDHIDAVVELTDTITLLGDDTEAEPTEESEDISDDELDPPADEETPEATEEDSTEDEAPEATEEESTDDEIPEATEEESTDDDSVDGTLYTSSGFGFTVEIPAIWAIDDEIVEDGSEQLILNNGTSIVTVWATTEYGDGTLSQCVTFAAEASGLELELDIRVDGRAFQGSDDLAAYGAFVYDNEGTEHTYYVKCSWIEDEQSVLIIIQDVPTEDYASERRFRRQLENAIDLP